MSDLSTSLIDTVSVVIAVAALAAIVGLALPPPGSILLILLIGLVALPVIREAWLPEGRPA